MKSIYWKILAVVFAILAICTAVTLAALIIYSDPVPIVVNEVTEDDYTVACVPDKSTVDPGETVTFTITVTDYNNDPVASKTVELLLHPDTTTVLDTATTNGAGVAQITVTPSDYGTGTTHNFWARVDLS